MRRFASAALFVVLTYPVLAQDEPKPIPPRFDVTGLPQNYPQDTPKQTLESVVRAIEKQRFDYLAAHLIDPAFVDAQMNENSLSFDAVVVAVRRSLQDDPADLKQLRVLAIGGQIDTQGERAIVTHEQVPGRKVFLVRNGDRWFIENQDRDPPVAPQGGANP